MKLLQLNALGGEVARDLADSFNNLPETDHKDGKYRLRKYSVIEYNSQVALFNCAASGTEIKQLPRRDFTQSEKFNEHQGGVSRSFQEIERGVLSSLAMREVCSVFHEANNLREVQEIEIHQIRVITQEDGNAEVAPEGVHQDGFDYIGMIGINRNNIEGGALMVYEGKGSEPFATRELADGEMIMLDDKKLWHNAKSISAIDKNEQGHGDWFVLCANI